MPTSVLYTTWCSISGNTATVLIDVTNLPVNATYTTKTIINYSWNRVKVRPKSFQGEGELIESHILRLITSFPSELTRIFLTTDL